MAQPKLAELIAQLGSGDEKARLVASEAIASAAEGGEDVTAALPALGQALADAHGVVRANAAWTFAYLGQNGADLAGQLGQLAGALGDANPKAVSNCAWALAQAAKQTDISVALERLAPLLDGEATFPNARAALGAALALPASREAARRAVQAHLERSAGAGRTRAALLLSRDDAARGQAQPLAERARHPDWHARFGVTKALGELAGEGELPPAGLGLLAELLGDAQAGVRQAAAGALVTAAEHGADLAPALPALATALGDPELAVRKEAIWAGVMVAYRSRPLGPARAALEACAREEATRGNASIALFLEDLNAGRRAAVEAQLAAEHGHTQFAAAYALTDHATRTLDRALLEGLLKRIRVGLLDISLSQGIAGSIAAMEERGEDVSFPLRVLSELINQTTDPVAQAPLMGVGMNLRRARGED